MKRLTNTALGIELFLIVRSTDHLWSEDYFLLSSPRKKIVPFVSCFTKNNVNCEEKHSILWSTKYFLFFIYFVLQWKWKSVQKNFNQGFLEKYPTHQILILPSSQFLFWNEFVHLRLFVKILTKLKSVKLLCVK